MGVLPGMHMMLANANCQHSAMDKLKHMTFVRKTCLLINKSAALSDYAR